MNMYLVMNNNGASKFIVCANNTSRAYELAKEKSVNEIFDRSFLLGSTNDTEDKVLREITSL